jgi:hypothetical protein
MINFTAMACGGAEIEKADWRIVLSDTQPLTLTVTPATALRWWAVCYNGQFQGVEAVPAKNRKGVTSVRVAAG